MYKVEMIMDVSGVLKQNPESEKKKVYVFFHLTEYPDWEDLWRRSTSASL